MILPPYPYPPFPPRTDSVALIAMAALAIGFLGGYLVASSVNRANANAAEELTKADSNN